MRTHYSNPNIIKAFDILERLSADEKTRMLAEQREKALKDEASMLGSARRKGEKIGLEKGEKIGLKKGETIGLKKGEKIGFEKTAKKLLAGGILSVEQIADATGLSVDEVRRLQD